MFFFPLLHCIQLLLLLLFFFFGLLCGDAVISLYQPKVIASTFFSFFISKINLGHYERHHIRNSANERARRTHIIMNRVSSSGSFIIPKIFFSIISLCRCKARIWCAFFLHQNGTYRFFIKRINVRFVLVTRGEFLTYISEPQSLLETTCLLPNVVLNK